MKKRLTTMLILLAMLFAMLPVTAYAATDIVMSGYMKGLVDGKTVAGGTISFDLDDDTTVKEALKTGTWTEAVTMFVEIEGKPYFNQSHLERNPVTHEGKWKVPSNLSVGGLHFYLLIMIGGKTFKSENFAVALDLTEGNVTGISDKAYNGNAQAQNPVVMHHGVTLQEGTDYELTYKNNKEIGIASVTITGKGKYVGSITKTFRINSPEYTGKEITPDSSVPFSTIENAILNLPNDKDPAWTTFSLLKAKGAPKSKRAIKLSWKRVAGAKGYVIYGNRCGRQNKYEKITLVSGTACTLRKLKKGTYHKYLIAAVNGDKVLAVSKTIHVATNGGKVGNNTKVTLNKKKKTLKVGKTFKLKATLKKGALKVKIHRKVAYESDNPNVATVAKNGKIRAVKAGTCYIYAYAQNGVFARCKVTVK